MNRTCEIHDTILQDDLKLRERPLKFWRLLILLRAV